MAEGIFLTVEVRLFGILTKKAPRLDRTGMVGIMNIDKEKVRDVSDILGMLDLRKENTGHIFLNSEYCIPSSLVSDGDTVAIFPSNMAIKWLQ
ncbi:MAG: hypothetical protein LUQ27_03570 [Methanomassiliicoccales archaeon]|nr:hypothetical protein [Methanomassiliicoccales archaeon]